MLKRLHLQQFKNFKDANLELGAFTLLVGTNASGKSNIRDAFRFLHGISRGYSLAEIIGEKWIEGGVLQWRGIRGGTREVTFESRSSFELKLLFSVKEKTHNRFFFYRIEVEADRSGKAPRVIGEHLVNFGLIKGDGRTLTTLEPRKTQFIFDSHPKENPPIQKDIEFLKVRVQQKAPGRDPTLSFLSQTPILSQFIERRNIQASFRESARLAMDALSSMRFLDLSPDAMRMPSIPGQTILGDRGENLSSVLQAICEDPERKQTLLQWVRELTPMDAKDFEFPSDFTGKILLTLVEENGQKISAYSASDGTLRFLGIIAALLGPEPARFYFIEELENGIHPTRLHLLLELIERQVYSRNIQIVATTHSPQLLRLLRPESLEYASLIYRLPDRQDAKIKRIIDIPEAKRVIEEQDLANLHESGWLEDMVYFLEDEESVE
jgi:predicted ATPase